MAVAEGHADGTKHDHAQAHVCRQVVAKDRIAHVRRTQQRIRLAFEILVLGQLGHGFPVEFQRHQLCDGLSGVLGQAQQERGVQKHGHGADARSDPELFNRRQFQQRIFIVGHFEPTGEDLGMDRFADGQQQHSKRGQEAEVVQVRPQHNHATCHQWHLQPFALGPVATEQQHQQQGVTTQAQHVRPQQGKRGGTDAGQQDGNRPRQERHGLLSQ